MDRVSIDARWDRKTCAVRIHCEGTMTTGGTKIEDYAFLSDTQTGALVSRDGCVDWLCLPRFDSPACFASLLGDTRNGHWRFFPEEEVVETRRRYRGDSLMLEAIAGPDGLILRTPIETRGEDLTTVAEFTVGEGEQVPFVLTWFASHKDPPRAIHYDHALH